MFIKCGILIVLVAFLVMAKADDEEMCKRLKEELEKKKLALKTMCTGKQPPYKDCCREVKRILNERGENLKRQCEPCPQFSIFFPKSGCKECVKDFVVSPGDMYSRDMRAITACVWVNIDSSTVKTPYLISYAASGHSNEFNLYARRDHVYLMIRNNVKRSAEVNIIDGKWHSVCARWTNRGGQYNIFVDGDMEARDSVMSGKALKRGGDWVLGQHQYSYGRLNNPKDGVEGEIANANVWNRVLSNSEIREFSASCLSKQAGNVKSWQDFGDGSLKGDVVKRNTSSCCSANVA